MSSLYEQLTNSGGVESETKSKSSPTTSYYHGNREQSNLSRFHSETNRVRKAWETSGGSWPTSRDTSKRKNERKEARREVYDAGGDYVTLRTDRPYAYQPSRQGVSPPTLKAIFLDFLVFAAETMLAAFGHALMEFFLHSRFRPSIGVKY